MICVDNLDTGSLQNVAHLRSEEFTFVNHDLTEPLFSEENVDVVFHLASPASPIDYMRLPLHTLKVGSYGTHRMLGLAKFKRARFLLASSSEVYGDPQVQPQTETYWGNVNPIGPRGVYDEAKRYAEALTMAYHRQQAVDTCIARIFNTYGSRMRRHDGRALTTFVYQALGGKPLTVFGDGSQIRSFCHVDDLVRGLHLLASSGEHLPVNLGSPSPMSLLELARKVIEATRSESEIIFDAPVSTSHTSGCPILRALVNFLTGSRRFPSRRSAPPDDIPSRPSRRRGSKRLGSSRSTRRASWEPTLRQPLDQLPGNGVVSSSVDLAFAVVLTCGGVFSCISLFSPPFHHTYSDGSACVF